MQKRMEKDKNTPLIDIKGRFAELSAEIKRGIVSFAIIILTLIFTVSATTIQSRDVGNVENFSASDCDSSSISLKWDPAKASKGYRIYATQNDGDYKLVKTVQGKKNTTAKIEKLNQATKYSFYVLGYNNKKQGAKSEIVSAFTAPSAIKISSAQSTDKGMLTVTWEENSSVSGYELQYVQGKTKDFSKSESADINDCTTTSKTVKDLKAKKEYSVRLRAYIKNSDKVINGKWSEIKTVTVSDTLVVDTSKPMVALTFDDGPGYNDASDRILDVLEKYNARATFFMVGKNAADHPENVKRKVSLGCEIGNHTYNHDHYGKNVSKEDIKNASDAIYEACGKYPTAFRSPGGNTTNTIRKECKSEKMALYYWSLDTEDWKSRNSESVYDVVMDNISDGDIVLMHEIYGSTADAVEKIVPELIEKGYQLVTCEELVRAKTGDDPTPGEQYVDGTTINNETS